jgi:Esterase-like activity of phytase
MRPRFPRIFSLFAFLAFPSSAQLGQMPISEQKIVLRTESVDLYPDNPGRKDLGRLRFEHGWALDGDNEAFGGWSAMVTDGNAFTLLGDTGAMLRFKMAGSTPEQAHLSALPKGCGFHWNKPDQDSESITRDPVSGDLWVGLEHLNAICRLDPSGTITQRVARPRSMARWSTASGPETMVRLSDARFMVIAEGDPRRGVATMPILIFDRDPTDPAARVEALALNPPKGFLPVDAAQMPDGRILLLTRRFTLRDGFTGRLVMLNPAGFRAGTVVSGAEVARFEAPSVADNFEAIAVSRDAGGIAVWIASDDNFFFLQRSLLLKFRLAD